MKVELRDYLYFYGYTNHPEIEHNTGFFEYSEHAEVDLANWKGFKSWNEKTLSKIPWMKAGEQNPEFYFNDKGFVDFDKMKAPTCWREITIADP